MSNLNCLKESIEELSKFHQVEILKILKSDDSITINENKNGIYINMTSLTNETLDELKDYMKYIYTQEEELNSDEQTKEIFFKTFF